MKAQLNKPSRSKARYTEEYKQEALELWRNSGRSAAKEAAELGIRAPLLYRWARPKRQANSSPSESKSKRSIEELEAEIRRLRTENAKLLEQREVLKKSLGILSCVLTAQGWSYLPNPLAAAVNKRRHHHAPPSTRYSGQRPRSDGPERICDRRYARTRQLHRDRPRCEQHHGNCTRGSVRFGSIKCCKQSQRIALTTL